MVDWPCNFFSGGVVPPSTAASVCAICDRAVVVPPAAIAAKARPLCYECDLELHPVGLAS